MNTDNKRGPLRILELGYRPTDKLDTRHPPKSRSGVVWPTAFQLNVPPKNSKK